MLQSVTHFSAEEVARTVTTCHIICQSHLNRICEITYCDTTYLIQELIQKFVNFNSPNSFLIIYFIIATILTIIINYYNIQYKVI